MLLAIFCTFLGKCPWLFFIGAGESWLGLSQALLALVSTPSASLGDLCCAIFKYCSFPILLSKWAVTTFFHRLLHFHYSTYHNLKLSCSLISSFPHNYLSAPLWHQFVYFLICLAVSPQHLGMRSSNSMNFVHIGQIEWMKCTILIHFMWEGNCAAVCRVWPLLCSESGPEILLLYHSAKYRQ